jgi:hypothetical protein
LQFNFAPVLDINTNPKNLLSVSVLLENKYKVTERAIALMKVCRKVFSTGIFLVTGIPTPTPTKATTVNFSKQRLEVMEFYPTKNV